MDGGNIEILGEKIMNQSNYPFEIDSFNEIPNKTIIEEFSKADVVKFSARRNNFIKYRNLAFRGINYWLPLTRVLPLIGITPAMLRPLVVPWWKRTLLPVNRVSGESYDSLDCFQITKGSFRKLAKILGKPIEVWREHPWDGDHDYLFTVFPD